MGLVSYDNSDDELSDGSDSDNPNSSTLSKDLVEPEFKMRIPKSAKTVNSYLDIHKSTTKEGKLDSSDDSDEDTTQLKTQQSHQTMLDNSTVKTNLLSLLPPARGFAKKERLKMIIPHQVAMKRNVPVKAAQQDANLPVPKSVDVPENNDDDVEIDEDLDQDESSSFFSFYTEAPQSNTAIATERAAAVSAIITAFSANVVKNETIQKEDDSSMVIQEKVVIKPVKSIEECLPKPVMDPEVLKIYREGSQIVEDEEESNPACWNETSFVPGPERKRARFLAPGTNLNTVDDLLTLSQTEIRSVNQADLTAGAQLELMKSVTGDDSQYRRRKTGDGDPGKLAHSKHQITWLAHQALENEIDLEKSWAASRSNRASNRAKYGF